MFFLAERLMPAYRDAAFSKLNDEFEDRDACDPGVSD